MKDEEVEREGSSFKVMEVMEVMEDLDVEVLSPKLLVKLVKVFLLL